MLQSCGRLAAGALALAAMSAVLIFGHDLLTQCDFFRSRQVQVQGHRQVSRQQIVALAGFGRPVNILAVNLGLARKRLLAHPYIAEAAVARQLPDRIVVRVRENLPVAVLDLGRRFLINTQGLIFKEMGPGDPKGLPLVSGLDFSDIRIGGMPQSKAYEAVIEVLSLGRRGQSELNLDRIAKIQVDRDIGLTLFGRKRFGTVRIGYRDYPDKFRALSRVLHYIEDNTDFPSVDAIDLNNLNRIIVDPISAARNAASGKEV